MTLMCIWWTDYEIYAPFYPSVYVLASFLACLATQLVNSLLVYGFFLVMLACCEWTSKLCFVGTRLLYYSYMFFFTCDLVPIWIMNVFPLVTKLYNQKNLSETLKPSFSWLNIWDCVGLFLCSLEKISGTNRTIIEKHPKMAYHYYALINTYIYS